MVVHCWKKNLALKKCTKVCLCSWSLVTISTAFELYVDLRQKNIAKVYLTMLLKIQSS